MSHYYVAIVPSPRLWEETVMGKVMTPSGTVVYEGTIAEVHNWIKAQGLKYLFGTNGIWVKQEVKTRIQRMTDWVINLVNSE